jgi:hypothetical protein
MLLNLLSFPLMNLLGALLVHYEISTSFLPCHLVRRPLGLDTSNDEKVVIVLCNE